MKKVIISFVVGLIFGVGLIIADMTNPQKVIGFLNLFNGWDPSLMFVMMGAIGVHFITYKIIRKNKTPALDSKWHVPTKTQITPSLVVGSILFGIGWGIAGFCPGPAFVSASGFSPTVLVFLVFMLIGMWIFKLVDKKVKFNR